MTFQRRLKFYLGGVGISSLIVFFFISQKITNCSYFPNDRVIAECLSKKIIFSEDFINELNHQKITDSVFLNKIFPKAKIDFEKSNVKSTCPSYLMFSQDKKLQFSFEKCKEQVFFKEIKKL